MGNFFARAVTSSKVDLGQGTHGWVEGSHSMQKPIPSDQGKKICYLYKVLLN